MPTLNDNAGTAISEAKCGDLVPLGHDVENWNGQACWAHSPNFDGIVFRSNDGEFVLKRWDGSEIKLGYHLSNGWGVVSSGVLLITRDQRSEITLLRWNGSKELLLSHNNISGFSACPSGIFLNIDGELLFLKT